MDTTSKTFLAIADPLTRSSALASLPPLAASATQTATPISTGPLSPPLSLPPSPLRPPPSAPQYPSYALTSHNPSLPLPPRPQELALRRSEQGSDASRSHLPDQACRSSLSFQRPFFPLGQPSQTSSWVDFVGTISLLQKSRFTDQAKLAV